MPEQDRHSVVHAPREFIGGALAANEG